MSEWRETCLTEITSKIGDGLHGTPKYNDNGEYYFINGNNLGHGKITIKPETKKVSKEEYSKYSKPISNKTILLSINGTIGNLALYSNEKCVLGKSACYINVNEKADKVFLYYVFYNKDFQYFLTAIATGTTIPNVPLKGIREYTFPLPPLPEQKAIAEVLSSLDDKIDLLHRQNKTLEQMAETLFRQWFVEEAGEGWGEKPLSSIANFLNGLACQKFPPKNEVNKLPVLKIKQLRNGFSDDSDWCTTEVKAKYIVENGNVIFSWSASLMVKIWNGEKCILNQHLFKVTSDEFPKWFYYLWSKHHLAEFVSISSSHATTMGHIKRGDLDNAMVLVPSPDEIDELSEIFTPLLDKIISNNKSLKNLASLRDTLLPKLMSGEVRVSYDKETSL
ncbi:MAG: restriction endonuclease subunit S [Gammaproteobacteria bacterium]|nr:restriction endonuclease subunit S [Gammaproteobacteria bacterium]